MSAALGSLVVSLEANVANFTSDMGKAAYQTEMSMKKMEAQAKLVGAAIATMGVAGAGALALMVKNSIDAADKLRDMSQKTGIAVDQLNGLGFAASQAGGSLDSMVAAAGKLNKSIAEAGQGSGAQSDAFKALGISVNDANGNLKTADVVMAEVADKFKTFKDGPEKVAIALALFGKAGADIIPVLNDGGDAMRENIAYAKQYSGITVELTNQADNFNDSLGKLHVQQQGFANTMTAAVLPILQAIADETLGAAEQSDKFALATAVVRTVLESMVVVGSEVAFVFKGVGTEIGGIAAQLNAVAHGDFKGFTAISDAMKEDAERARVEHDKFIARIMDRTPSMVAIDGTPTAKKPAPRIPDGAAAKQLADENAKLVAGVRESMAALKAEVDMGRQLTPVEKEIATLYEKIGVSKNKYTLDTLLTVDALMQEKLATETVIREQGEAMKHAQERQDLRNKENKEIEAWFEKQQELYNEAAKTMRAYQQAYRVSLSGMGQGDAERNRQAGIASLQDRFKGQPDLLEQSLKDWDKYLADKTAAEAKWQLGSQEALANYLVDVSNVYQSVGNMTIKTFKGMEDALVNFVMTGKLDFASLANSIISDMVRIAIQQSITKPLAASFLGMFADGGAFGSGGVQAFASGGAFSNSIISNPTLFKFSGGTGMMGEAGPEAIMPLARGPNGKLGVQATGGAGGRQVIFNQYNTVGDVATVSMLQKSLANSQRQIVSAFARSQNYGGAVA
jgi:lambda family phage tail tape measure protein